jgi:hypothetical protein
MSSNVSAYNVNSLWMNGYFEVGIKFQQLRASGPVIYSPYGRGQKMPARRCIVGRVLAGISQVSPCDCGLKWLLSNPPMIRVTPM